MYCILLFMLHSLVVLLLHTNLSHFCLFVKSLILNINVHLSALILHVMSSWFCLYLSFSFNVGLCCITQLPYTFTNARIWAHAHIHMYDSNSRKQERGARTKHRSLAGRGGGSLLVTDKHLARTHMFKKIDGTPRPQSSKIQTNRITIKASGLFHMK